MNVISLCSKFLSFFGALLMVGVVIAMFSIRAINTDLPDANEIKQVELKIPLRVYSAENKLIAEFGDERRKPVRLDQAPQTLINAILASEDDRFYTHKGVDFFGLVRAALSNVKAGQHQQGASTITMQVARNFFLTREKTYIRKIREILLSIKLEQILSKDDILNLYINKIFLGHRAYGFGAAAQVYYGKELDQLTLAETAMLAGLPKAPSTNNPLRNPERALARRNYVLSRMLNLDYISQQQYDQAKQQVVSAQKHNRNIELKAHYVAEMVRQQILEIYGEEAYWQGLNVYTTIRADHQQAAQIALQKGLENYDRRHGFRGAVARINLGTQTERSRDELVEQLKDFPDVHQHQPALVISTDQNGAELILKNGETVQTALTDNKWMRPYLDDNNRGPRPTSLQDIIQSGDILYITENRQDGETIWQITQIPDISGSLVSMQPNNGKIVALVGGYDFFLNKYNRASQSQRQPGSNIKPFLYSASLDKGFTPASVISGAPIVMRDKTHGTVWRPENYSGKFFGPTRMRTALTKSMNLVSIRLLRAIGIDYTLDYLARFGIDRKRFSPSLTLALGAGNITPLEMLNAYSTLANGGYSVTPILIDSITDRHGEVIYQSKLPVLCDSCYEMRYPSAKTVDEIGEITPTAEYITELPSQSYTYQASRVMSEANNYLTVSMLQDVITRGTARKAQVLERHDLAGKTGTTNDYVDAWFSGFNQQLATTVWVGFDQPRSMGRGEAGSVAALPIWIDYMKTALADMPDIPRPIPATVGRQFIDPQNGQPVSEITPGAIEEYVMLAQPAIETPTVDNSFSNADEIPEHSSQEDIEDAQQSLQRPLQDSLQNPGETNTDTESEQQAIDIDGLF